MGPATFRELVEKACVMAEGRSATVRSLADALGVSYRSFYKYHSGHRKTPQRVFDAVERIVNGEDRLVETKRFRRSHFGPAATHHAVIPG